MTATKPERPVIVVTDDTTRAEIAECIGLCNVDAKQLSRRGHVGTASAEYDRKHRLINDLLDDYELA